jgi:hypothetical protein
MDTGAFRVLFVACLSVPQNQSGSWCPILNESDAARWRPFREFLRYLRFSDSGKYQQFHVVHEGSSVKMWYKYVALSLRKKCHERAPRVLLVLLARSVHFSARQVRKFDYLDQSLSVVCLAARASTRRRIGWRPAGANRTTGTRSLLTTTTTR